MLAINIAFSRFLHMEEYGGGLDVFATLPLEKDDSFFFF